MGKCILSVILICFLGSNATATLQSTEDQVLRILTGQDEYEGQKISERGSSELRALTRKYLSEKLTSFGYEPQIHTYSDRGANVYATLKATTDSQEYIIVGAHFDSVGNPGANDNASGVAIVMAMAEKLMQQATRNKSIYFIFFDEEEDYYRGSKAFARKLKDENAIVHSVHTIDQFGFNGDGDRAIELEAAPDDLFDFYQSVNLDGNFNIQLLRSPVTATDHHSFRQLGFKALGITEEYYHGDTTNCYHSACDTYETINFEYLHLGSRFFKAVISALLLVKD